MLLDPRVSPYYTEFVDQPTADTALKLLKDEHHILFEKMNVKDNSTTDMTSTRMKESSDESSSDSDDFDFLDTSCNIGSKDAEQQVIPSRVVSDGLVDSYIKYANNIVWERFVVEGKVLKPKKSTLQNLLDKADMLMWYQKEGKVQFPAISVLARKHLPKMTSGAMQEHVFSTAGNAMSKTQTRMNFSQLEMRTILSHNDDYCYNNL